MSSSKKPDYMDAMKLSQEDLNLNRVNQYTPYGSKVWKDGELHINLNPADQQRLDANRLLLAGLGNSLGEGAGIDAGKKNPAAAGAHQPGFEPGSPEVGTSGSNVVRRAVPRGR